MSRKIIDTDLLSKEREDIFDEYYSKIEQLKLKFNTKEDKDKFPPNYNLIEVGLTLIERNLDDLSSVDASKQQKVKRGNAAIKSYLKEWFIILEKWGENIKFIEVLAYNLVAAAAVLSHIENIKNIEFTKLIKYLSPSKLDYPFDPPETIVVHEESFSIGVINVYDDENDDDKEMNKRCRRDNEINEIPYNKEIMRTGSEWGIIPYKFIIRSAAKRYSQDSFKSLHFDKIEKYELEKYRRIVNNSQILKELQQLRTYPNDATFTWDIYVKIDDENDNFKANEIAFLMWTLSEALGQIEDVEVTLEDWGNGSKWFKFNVKAKTEVAKEEVKQVLEKARKGVEAQHLDKPIEEVEKLRAETEQIKKQTQTLVNEADAKEIQRLQIEKMQLENEALKADVMTKKLNVVEQMSELITKGILKNDSDIQIMINDLLFIERKGDELIIGEDIEIIEEDQIIQLPPTQGESNKAL